MGTKKKNSKRIEAGDNSIGIGGDVNNSQINHVYSNIGDIKKRPDLTRVIEVREFGHNLLAAGIHLIRTEEVLRDWYMTIRQWEKDLVIAVSEIDKDKGKLMETLFEVPNKDFSQHTKILNKRHLSELECLSERLRILEKFINDYLQLPL